MQDLLPAPPSPNKRLLAKTQQQQQPEPWLPSQKLCAVLSDMREARQKQLEVAETLRGGVPRRWWGAQMGSGQPKLGSRMQIIQVLQPKQKIGHFPIFFFPCKREQMLSQCTFPMSQMECWQHDALTSSLSCACIKGT